MISTGLNYTHFAPPAGETGQLGVVHEYHLHRPTAQAQFAQMRAAGMTDLRIPLYVMAQEELGGLENGFTLKLYGSSLDGQRQENVVNLMADAKAAGFEWISLGPGPAGEVLGMSNWTVFDQAAYDRWGQFLVWIRSLGPDQIDLGEMINPGLPVMMRFAQTLWGWATVSWGNAVPTIGLTAGGQNATAAPGVYRGLDQSGPINWPEEIGLHLYGPVPFRGHGSFYSIGCLMLNELLTQGMPLTTKLSIHERYDFIDATTNAETARLITDYPQLNWARVLQWPMLTGTGQFATSPCLTGASF